MIMTKNEMSSRIVRNEITIINAITKGHKPSESDEYQPLRIETEILRCLYYGEDSPFCRRKYTIKKGDR